MPSGKATAGQIHFLRHLFHCVPQTNVILSSFPVVRRLAQPPIQTCCGGRCWRSPWWSRQRRQPSPRPTTCPSAPTPPSTRPASSPSGTSTRPPSPTPSSTRTMPSLSSSTRTGGSSSPVPAHPPSRCGHCRAFAPFYRQFSQIVKEWGSVVTVAAMNCADAFNAQTCRENGITHYPMLKVRRGCPLFE